MDLASASNSGGHDRLRYNFVDEDSPYEAMEVSCDHRVVEEEEVPRIEATLDIPLTHRKMSCYF